MGRLPQLIFFLASVQAIWNTGLSIRIEIQPVQYDGVMMKVVNITCKTDEIEKPAGLMVATQLFTEDGKFLASVHQDSTIFYGDRLKINITGEGNASDDKMNSHLTVTMYNVLEIDSGEYTCVAHYFDPQGFVVETKDSGYLDVGRQDVGDVFRNLSHQILQLEHRLQYQEDIRKNEDLVAIEQMNKSLGHLEDKVTFMSAFSATLGGSPSNLNSGDVIVFDKVILKIGRGYNETSGVFTVPRKGLYVFHLVARADYGDYFNIHLKVDEEIVVSLDVQNKDYNDQSSVSAVVLLDSGQKVKPVVHHGSSSPFDNNDGLHKYSLFSGYIIKTL